MNEHYDPEFQGRKIAAQRAIGSVKQFIGEEATDPLNYLGGGMFGAAKTGAKLAGKALIGAGLMRQDKEAEATIFGLDKVPADVMEWVVKAQKKGIDEQTIFQKTGVDVKSKKYYVPDTQAKWVNDAFRLTTKPEPLSRYFANDPVMKLMPELGRLRIMVDPSLPKRARAGFYPHKDLVVVSPNMLGKPKELLQSIIHEVQHAVQTKQLRPAGSNFDTEYTKILSKYGFTEDTVDPAMAKSLKSRAFEVYRQNPGEQEARLSQKLSNTDLRKAPEYEYQSLDDLMRAETMYDDINVNPFYNELLNP
jgi:hypothetical protein